MFKVKKNNNKLNSLSPNIEYNKNLYVLKFFK